MRRRALVTLKVSVSLTLLGWVIHASVARDGMDALRAKLGALDPLWLVAAVLVQLGAVGLGVERWRALLGAQGVVLPRAWLARCYLVGRFVGTVTPSTAGLDLHRGLAVARRTGARGASASAILVEKCVGLLGLCLLSLVVLASPSARLFGPGAPLGAAAIAAASLVGLAILSRPGRAATLLRLLPSGLAARARGPLEALGARGLSARLLGGTVLLSLCAHGLTAGVFVVSGRALGLEVSSLTLLVVGISIVVATLLPISIGGVGVREGVAVLLLGGAGVGATDATLVALVGYLAGQVPAVLGGLEALRPSARAAPAPEGLGAVAGTAGGAAHGA